MTSYSRQFDFTTSSICFQNAPYCQCSSCRDVSKTISQLTDARKSYSCPPDVRLGARVIVRGRFPGSIRYVGDLDSNFVNSKIYVGVKLDDPIGKHDGLHHGKRFFKCPPGHGIFVPLEQVHVTVPVGKGSGLHKTRKPHNKPASLSNDQVSVIPLVGSQPSTTMSTKDTERAQADLASPLQNNPSIATSTKSSSMLNANTSNLFTVKPIRPKTAGKNFKREGALAPSPLLTPISSELMQSSYQSSSNYDGDEEKDEEGGSRSSLPSLTRLSKSEQSALKLPRPPPNEMNTDKWKDSIEAIKANPAIPKLYLTRPPSCTERECFALEGRRRSSERDFVTRAHNLQLKTSYTSRLLSGLPKYETALPFLSEDKGNDVDQFSYWLKKWGGGIKGWKMATTLQKLKDAKRQGDTEIKWQEKIDELEADEEFSGQVKKIKKLQAELCELRTQRDKYDSDMRLKTFVHSNRDAMDKVERIQESVLDYQKKAIEEEGMCEKLEEIIRDHKMAPHIDSATLNWLT